MVIDARKEMFLLASSFYGLKEIPGKKHNPIILKWFREIGHKWVQDDETAWCSCFINWLAMKCKLERSGELTARSWLEFGKEITKPQRMIDLVIFWRGSPGSWKGHVGIYMGQDEDYTFCFGGNQSNMVNITPYHTYQVLGYRRLQPILKGGPTWK